MKNNQKGFIGIVSLVGVIMLVSVVGYFIFVKNSAEITQQLALTQKATINSDSIPNNEDTNYLVIKEWEVELKKPKELSDLQFATSSGTFTTQQLLNLDKTTGGKCTGYSIGYMTRYTIKEFDNLKNDKYGIGVPNNVKIGNYYYSFELPQEACSFNKQFKELEVKQTSLLQDMALNSLRATN